MYCLVFQCFIFLDDAQGVADILEKLIKDNEVSGSGPFELSWCTQFTITYFSVHGDLLSYPGILTSRTAIIIFDCLELGGLEQYNSVWFICYMLMYNSPRLGKTNKAWSQNCRLYMYIVIVLDTCLAVMRLLHNFMQQMQQKVLHCSIVYYMWLF